MALSLPLHSQVSLDALYSAYTQDFNTLISSGTDTWIDNTTLPGWYHARTGTGNAIVAGNGASSAGALYSFGETGGSDRALGSIGSGNAAVGDMYWGVRLVNNTGETITSLSVSYFGEQWRYSGTSVSQSITFSYRVGVSPGNLTGGNWTEVSELHFISPVILGSTGALDGNATANRAFIAAVINVTLQPNEEIMLRWFDADHPGSDHGLTVDDFAVTPFGTSGPTIVEFRTPISMFGEGAGTVSIDIRITNPDSLNATQLTVELVGGTAVNGVDVSPAFAPRNVIFPAGCGDDQRISITLVDDTLYTGNRTLIFELCNVSGGNNANLGVLSRHTLTIVENDAPPHPSIVINEYFNAFGSLSTDEAIELYVVEDALDIRGYSIADATSSGMYPYGILTFSNDSLWSNLPAGAVIVLGGFYSVPIQDTDVSDGLLKLQVPLHGSSNRYFTHSSNAISIAGSSDAVAVRDASGDFIHGLAHGTDNQATLPAERHGFRASSLPSGASLGFSRYDAPMSGQDFLNNAHVHVMSPNIGLPNDTSGNRERLRSLRSRHVVTDRLLAGSFFWDVLIDNRAVLTLSGPVNVGNMLRIAEGRLNEDAQGLSLDANGNALNGAGEGTLVVGDDVGHSAVLALRRNPYPISGVFDATACDATVEYYDNASQVLMSGVYNNLTLLNGGRNNPKSVNGAVIVAGKLVIDSDACLVAHTPWTITLGESGNFSNNGYFAGAIRSSRTYTGESEDFGGIGVTLRCAGGACIPLQHPERIRVTMHSSSYVWIEHLPSILRYYTIEGDVPVGHSASMSMKYDEMDLNGQNEYKLSLFRSTNNGSTWNSRGGTLDMMNNTVSLDLDDIRGMWTMHGDPPRGSIVANPDMLRFESEQYGTLPSEINVTISNAMGEGSIIEWTANPATGNEPAWLAIAPDPAAAVNDGGFLVSILRSDLEPGTYYTTITVKDEHAVNHPLHIPVSYRVHARREISIGVDTLRIKLSSKKARIAANIPVFNAGGAFGPGVIAWNASSNATWLQVTKNSGMEGENMEITIDSHLLTSGTYYSTLEITGVNSFSNAPIFNSPLHITLCLEVEAASIVQRNASQVTGAGTTVFYNDHGHRIASVKVTSGVINTLSLRLHPFALPRNIHRLHYARRHYQIEATGNYTADITFWYTLHELEQSGLNDASLLRAWRQNPVQFQWTSYGGYSNPVEQSVTATNVADLNGIWAMAHMYTLSPLAISNPGVEWTGTGESRLSWESNIDAAIADFIVQCWSVDKDAWHTVGTVSVNHTGSYAFRDSAICSSERWYRIVGVDTCSSMSVFQPILLRAVHSPDREVALCEGFALGECLPNPLATPGGIGHVSFTLPKRGNAVLKLYDIAGKELALLASALYDAGTHEIPLHAGKLSPGIYFYRLTSAFGTLTRKVLLVR